METEWLQFIRYGESPLQADLHDIILDEDDDPIIVDCRVIFHPHSHVDLATCSVSSIPCLTLGNMVILIYS